MEPPKTPSKKKGVEINRLVRSLNQEWGLRLPDRTTPFSPSQIVNPDAIGERIYRLICFLYFQRHEDLQQACKRFEEHAQQQAVEWVHKPLGDTDTLPSRKSSGPLFRRGSHSRVNGASGTAVVALEETLFRFLNEAKEAQPSPTPTKVLSPLSMSDLPSRTPQSTHVSDHFSVRGRSSPRSGNRGSAVKVQQSIKQWALPTVPSMLRNPLRDDQTSPTRSAPSSAYLSHPDHDTSDILQELVMAQIEGGVPFTRQLGMAPDSPTPLRVQAMDRGDVLTAPPSTPLGQLAHDADPRIDRTESHPDEDMTEQYVRQETDGMALPLNQTPGGKKRPLLDGPIFPVPRKRETYERQQVYGVNHLEPTVSSGAFDRRRSFDNSSQNTTSTRTTASTTTTPNTSFYTETAATSFGPSIVDDASSQLLREHEVYNRQLLAETHLDPRQDAMNLDVETPSEAERFGTGPAADPINSIATQSGRFDTADYLRRHLEAETPFASSAADSLFHLPFRQLYEISRIALHCKTPLSAVSSDLTRAMDDQELLWSSLQQMAEQGKPMPEKSRAEAWEKAETEPQYVVFSGDLSFSDKISSPTFDFRLKPMRVDKSNRFSRKFGGDRFFILGIPGFTPNELPPFLKCDAAKVRNGLISWLLETDHRFLGRTWRAFLVKPQQMSTDTRRKNMSNFNAVKHRIFLFAVDGCAFRRRSSRSIHKLDLRKWRFPITIHELLEWFMPMKLNMDQSCLKLFARLNLAVSDTASTITFKPTEIVRTSDALADSPAVRRLLSDRHQIQGGASKPLLERVVMNDGCARISRAAAAAISNMLGIYGLTPSVFQGRIGGAKGMWMVDALNEVSEGSERDYWIEITDSQLKFEGHPIDAYDPDPARSTFEVHSIPTSLSATTLNYQLMPILIDRGVPGIVFERLLQDDLTAKVSELEAAMDSGLALRKWTQENSSVAAERRIHGTVEWMGGMPSSLTEKINWFVEHGFEPKSCRLLKDYCFTAVRTYCDRLESRMNIGLGRSTFAFMIADPLAVLEEGEVHLGFSGAFRDEVSGFYDTMLNDIDILVARLPAHLPSDIQKVRAVFKPELAIYKDVIIFSSKGQCSLAERLSGGDYDGDRAWICWEPSLVDPFINAETHSAPPDDFYCLEKDSTKVSELLEFPDHISRFLRKGFEFSIQPHMLGMCTAYHEALCYHNRSIAFPIAKDIAILLGRLVDSAKGGLLFTEQTWIDFKRKQGLPLTLVKPAYKKNSSSQPTNHIIDRLVFHIAKGVSERALGEFSKQFESARDWDDDLNAVWKAEDERSKSDASLKTVLVDLRAQLESLHGFWTSNCAHVEADEFRPSRSNPSETSLKARVEQTRERFLAIQPPTSSRSAIVDRWRKDDGSTRDAWTRLKASALWNRYYKCGKFAWNVCGKELGELKLLGRGGGRCVGEELWVHYRLDARSVKKLEAAEAAKGTGSEGLVGDGDGEEEGEEEFGGWDDDWLEGMMDYD
ncbi:hypothetical protein MMC30_004014 [Trapelia coarctata]|nr:hypothetical protein [Trapelia coarctata]